MWRIFVIDSSVDYNVAEPSVTDEKLSPEIHQWPRCGGATGRSSLACLDRLRHREIPGRTPGVHTLDGIVEETREDG